MLSKVRLWTVFSGGNRPSKIQHLQMIIILRDHSKMLYLCRSYLLLAWDGKTSPRVPHCLQNLVGAAVRGEPKHRRDCGVLLPPAQPSRGKKTPKPLLSLQIYALNFVVFRNLVQSRDKNEAAPRGTPKAHPYEIFISNPSPEQGERVLMWTCTHVPSPELPLHWAVQNEVSDRYFGGTCSNIKMHRKTSPIFFFKGLIFMYLIKILLNHC